MAFIEEFGGIYVEHENGERRLVCLSSGYLRPDYLLMIMNEGLRRTDPEEEQPTPAAEVIIELSKRVSALEEWKERHNLHPFERHQPRDTTNVTPIPEFDAGL